ncbi:MAG TPA: oligosaccharide flippase family protein [Candidatus Dojkabacteria bacterium]|nr:oligosaccharide flippase family protein [Methanofastidiosum sp.]HRZ84723.1 oligosaccharide flippase family protein [Candidatus Dojkabacteria bacterium]
MKSLLTKLKDKYLGKGTYKKNVVKMVGARVVSQLIPILLSPLLTRIYTPQEFGVFEVYLTVVSIAGIISNGRYALSLLLPKKDRESHVLALLSVFLTTVFTVVLTALIYLFRDRFFVVLNVESIKRYLPLLSLNILFFGICEIFFILELRKKQYKRLAINVIVQSTVMIISRITFGYMEMGAYGLILSYLLGYIVSTLHLLYKFKLLINFDVFEQEVKGLAKQYVNFPKFSLISDGMQNLTNSFPSILLNKYFGSNSAGYFSLSDKILGSPLWFVTSSVGDVYRQEASEQYRKTGSCKSVFIKTVRGLLFFGIVPFLIIFLVVPLLIPFVFGSDWSMTGTFVRVFSLMYFTSFLTNPILYTLNILNKQKYLVLFQVIKLFSIIIAFVIGFYYKNIILTLAVWSVLVSVGNLFALYLSYRFVSKLSDYYNDSTEIS